MCCFLSICKACQTYVLRVQIWDETYSSLLSSYFAPVSEALNRLRIGAPFQ